MCTYPIKSIPREFSVGEEHLQTWHVLSVHKRTVGERIQGLRVFNLKHSLQRK